MWMIKLTEFNPGREDSTPNKMTKHPAVHLVTLAPKETKPLPEAGENQDSERKMGDQH